MIDETGFAKKGDALVGVARQHSGALSGVFPCQVGVMVAWATTRGQALVDRELYLPRSWVGDQPRREAAHVPDQVGFATRPRFTEKMIERILPEYPPGTWAADPPCVSRTDLPRGFWTGDLLRSTSGK